MAEVENSTPATTTAALPTAPATDIPLSAASGSDLGVAAELGTSPTQERSSNSHPHDSEYDTASDLEGGDDYDDEDLDEDESLSEDESDSEDDGASETEDEEEAANDTVTGNGVATDKAAADAEAQKKVDEDRSNPQYIPKRGTFYEHDDRTADGENVGDPAAVTAPGGAVVEIGADAGANSSVVGIGAALGTQTPTISQASKTMKKWQPASGVERWSHDRFEASEQAPKSRSELLSSYGYDIRNEDAPPRARRRRRYGRGPSKYSRNWEDGQAYLKTSNKERKPPRPSDFPALNERVTKERKPRNSLSREEKENRGERRMANTEVPCEKLHNNVSGGGGGGSGGGGSSAGGGNFDIAPGRSFDNRERRNRRNGRSNGMQEHGRQPAREFKPKPNRGDTHRIDPRERVRDREQNSRMERGPPKSNMSRSNAQPNSMAPKQMHSQNDMHAQMLPEAQMEKSQNQLSYQANSQQIPTQQQQVQSQPTLSHSNLSQRLQQVQQRNDPSHVGSVQMHALATQNHHQQQQQQQQQQHQMTTQQQQQQQQQLPPQLNSQQQILEQRASNAPKRYSSMRRTQHDAVQTQHIVDQQQQQQHQLQQQLQLQQQQQQQQPQLILQDPHVLMQIYEQQQQHIQVQLQSLQLGQAAPVAVPQQAPKQHAPPPNAYPQPQGAPPGAYYVTAAEQVPPTAPPYANPTAAAGYMQQTPAVVYAQAPPAAAQPQPPPPQQVPQTATQTAQPPPPSMNYHQNYNTVGGTTYFVPPAQTTTRPSALPQRRPTNAIPILPPSEKHKIPRSGSNTNANVNAGESKSINSNVPKAEENDNIDHIIDNMFVQRPAFQPPSSAATAVVTTPTEVKTSAEDASNNAAAVSVSAELANKSTPPVAAAVQE